MLKVQRRENIFEHVNSFAWRQHTIRFNMTHTLRLMSNLTHAVVVECYE